MRARSHSAVAGPQTFAAVGDSWTIPADGSTAQPYPVQDRSERCRQILGIDRDQNTKQALGTQAAVEWQRLTTPWNRYTAERPGPNRRVPVVSCPGPESR